MNEKSLAVAIKELRVILKVNQSVFAENRLGKSTSTVQRYERGENVDPTDLAKMTMMARAAGSAELAEFFKAATIDSITQEVMTILWEHFERNGTAKADAQEVPVDVKKSTLIPVVSGKTIKAQPTPESPNSEPVIVPTSQPTTDELAQKGADLKARVDKALGAQGGSAQPLPPSRRTNRGGVK